MTTIVPYRTLGIRQRFEWSTGILKVHDGSENRICYRQNPRETFEIDFAVDLEQDRRDLRIALFTGGVAAWKVIVDPESVIAKADVSGAAVTIDSTYLDWIAVGQAVYVEGPNPDDADGAFTATITALGGTTTSKVLTLSAGPTGDPLPKKVTRVYRLASLLLDDNQASARAAPSKGAREAGANKDIGSGVWTAKANTSQVRTVWGTGGAALTSFDGYYVLEQRPRVETSAEESFMNRLERFDGGGIVTQEATQTYADIKRSHLYQAAGDAERQRWILFFVTLFGPQVAFLLPTWQPDLELVSDPSGGTTLTVYKEPGFGVWFASAAHRHLQLEKADGSIQYLKASGVVDNLDGTETITVTSAVIAGTVTRISMLELVRLAEDSITFDHQGDHIDFELRALVVQR